MKDSVIGEVSFDVKVKCPHCNENLSINQYPYDNEELGVNLFGGYDNPAKWSGLAIEYKCVYCEKDFTLTGFEI